MVLRLFKLQHVRPDQMRHAVQSVLGETGQTAADERTRAPIVTASAENTMRVEGQERGKGQK